MNTKTCDGCGNDVQRWEAVERGDGHRVHYWHRDCYTLQGIQHATVAGQAVAL